MEFNLSQVVRAVADAVPDREAVVHRDRRLTYRRFLERADRLANVLHEAGLGCRTERDRLRPWESGQDHLALYLHNGTEYLEGMLGAYAARVAPFNVNYRYVAEELRYLLDDSGARAIVYHSAFAPVLVGVVGSGNLEVMLEPGDGGDCAVHVQTSARGFAPVWQAVLDDFHHRHELAGVRVSINDMGATPAVVSLRLDQAVRELRP